MNTLNMTAFEAKYYMEAHTKMVEKIINGIRRYFRENAEMITAGILSMNSSSFRPYRTK